MSNRIWTPVSAEKRCEASWHDELLDKYWMGLRCYLCLCHSGEHQYKWEEENETPEEYMKWLDSDLLLKDGDASEGREECS